MKKNKMSMRYDEEGDYLEIYFGRKIKEGYFKELKDKCFARIDKKTGKVVGYTIFSFSKRKEKFVNIEIPFPGEVLA